MIHNRNNFEIDDKVYMLSLRESKDYRVLARAISICGETGKLPMTGTIINIREVEMPSLHGSTSLRYYYDVKGTDGRNYSTGPFDVYIPENAIDIVSKNAFMKAIDNALVSNLRKMDTIKKANENFSKILSKYKLLGGKL